MAYQTGRVIQLGFRPVKGAGMVEGLEQAMLEPAGLSVGLYGDHEFMMVDAKPGKDYVHHFLSQRNWLGRQEQRFSAMARIRPVFVDGVIHLTWDYQDDIELPFYKNDGDILTVEVQKDICEAVDQGDVLAEWLSDHLDYRIRLVKAAGPFRRLAGQNYIKNACPVRFQDRYPMHWVTMGSVNELSERAGYEIPWQTFRPQAVVDGMDAQYEHKVNSGLLAEIPFCNPKPCQRCAVTNIDQQTAEFKRGRALVPLEEYKYWADEEHGDQGVIFGENALIFGSGPVRLGDEMVTLSIRNPPLVYGPKKL